MASTRKKRARSGITKAVLFLFFLPNLPDRTISIIIQDRSRRGAETKRKTRTAKPESI